MRKPAPPLPDWIATMFPRGIDRYRLDVGGGEMAVVELGEGRPVLMVHGNPSWSFLYRKVMQALADEPLRLIAPDLIGLGLSTKPSADAHTLDNHAAWLSSLVEQLDLRDAIVVGQDWGGPIGFLAAAAHPDRFTGMVILNAVVSEPRQGFKPTAFHQFAKLPVASDLAFRVLGFPQNVMGFAQGDRHSIRGAVGKAYRWPLSRIRDRAGPLAMVRMVPDSHSHPSIPALRRCREYVESFTGPIEVVWGERDPVLGSVIGWIERLLPHANVTRTEGGHFLQEEVPGSIAAAICRLAAADQATSAPA